MDDEHLIAAMYRAVLEREPDAQGLRSWSEKLANGESFAEIIDLFMETAEFHDLQKKRDEAKVCTENLINFVRETSDNQLLIADVGAQNLEYENHVYSPLQQFPKTKVIGFEPLVSKLQERVVTDGEKNVTILPSFIGDGRSHVFHINEPDATSSLLPFNFVVTKRFKELNHLVTVETKKISTVKLDDVLANVERLDFLKLDIQGFEYEALLSAVDLLSRTLVVHCEVSFMEIYKGQKLFADVDRLLQEADFRFVSFNHLCEYSLVGDGSAQTLDQLGWGDAVYFRDVGEKEDPCNLLIQSVIAALVYGKLSFARHLAGKYDGRTGDSLEKIFAVSL